MLIALMLSVASQIDVANQKQLFIDHKYIESAEGVSLVVQQPIQTFEKLVTTDADWETDATLGSYSTVVQEGNKIRLWYDIRAGIPEPRKNPPFMGVAYAESTDGIHFEKKPLGIVARNGSTQNNLVLPLQPELGTLGGGTVWRDENPQVAPDARYKSWSKFYPKSGSPLRGPHRLWKSPDGLQWSLDEQMMTGLRAADTQPSWFWDHSREKYICYSREWIRERPGFGARFVSYNESTDMLNWSSMQISLAPDERDAAARPSMHIDPNRLTIKGEDILPQQTAQVPSISGEDPSATPMVPIDFYGPGVFPYEGVYLALIPAFYHWRGSADGAWPNTSDLQLAISRDARHFTRPGPRKPFLRTGPSGSWSSKWIYPILKPVRMENELWIYFMGTNRDHSGRLDSFATKNEAAISRAVLRLDGFIAAEADYEGGILMTPPLRFQGSRLELNLDTGAGGVAQVELLQESGAPIEGFRLIEADELSGNHVRFVASWKGGKTDISSLAGQSVRLRLKLRSAKLFAFQFQ